MRPAAQAVRRGRTGRSLGQRAAAAAVRDPVFVMADAARIAIFPLPGALLFPRARLPLHIFEPRYRAMIADAVAGDQRIGMVQPRDDTAVPALFDVGCLGRITRCDSLPD